MRTIAYDLLTVISYTINNKNDRKHFIKKAHQFSEVLKIKIQIAKQITMLSFKAFETLANLPNVSNAWQLNLSGKPFNTFSMARLKILQLHLTLTPLSNTTKDPII
jgi:hypothetical protein